MERLIALPALADLYDLHLPGLDLVLVVPGRGPGCRKAPGTAGQLGRLHGDPEPALIGNPGFLAEEIALLGKIF